MDLVKTVLVSRVSQLAGRVVMLFLAGLATKYHLDMDQSTFAGVSSEVVALVGVGLGFMYDLGVHYFQHGAVITHTQDGPGMAEQDRQIEKALPIIPQ